MAAPVAAGLKFFKWALENSDKQANVYTQFEAESWDKLLGRKRCMDKHRITCPR